MSIDWSKKYNFKQLFNIGNQIDYPLNPTRHEIRNVLSGTRKVKHGKSIHAAARYLRRNEGTISMVAGPLLKRRQEEILRKYSSLIQMSSFPIKIGEGVEHKVYGYDERTVVKINNLHYYSSWTSYFNNLLLHNYFFQDTAYKLIGFAEQSGKLFPVITQPFIKLTETTDLDKVRKILSDTGFTSEEDLAFNYTNKDLGIMLEDLHSKNVLTRENPETKQKSLYFIDTIFHILPELYT